MPSIRTDRVVVPDRFRQEEGDIAELAESLKKYGLLQPIVIDSEAKLVAGARRLAAARLLGWTEIEYRQKGRLTELERRTMEVEENIRRKQFTWQEEVKAKQELHHLMQELHGTPVKGYARPGGSWGMRETAAMLGDSLGGVSQDIQLAEAMAEFPEITEHGSKREAMRSLRKAKELALLTELAFRAGTPLPGGLAEEQLWEIVVADCIEHMRTLPSESFDLCITDPPYGIDIDTGFSPSSRQAIQFNDAPAGFQLTIDALVEIYRLLKDGSHCYVFCDAARVESLVTAARGMGWTARQVPLIWVKEGGGFTDFHMRFMPMYEAIMFLAKGERYRPLVEVSADVFIVNREFRKIHPTQKPLELIEHFVELSSVPGERILDPFCGSGTTLVAAALQGRYALGIERSAEYVAGARVRIEEDLKGMPKEVAETEEVVDMGVGEEAEDPDLFKEEA